MTAEDVIDRAACLTVVAEKHNEHDKYKQAVIRRQLEGFEAGCDVSRFY